MAELGIAASLIGITTFGIKLTHHLYDFGSTAASAREQTDYIARHVNLYTKALDLLKERLDDDQPVHSTRALDLVEEIYDQSFELFYKIRDLLPQRPRRGEDLSFMKKVKWVFRKSRVELLVGEIDYLKSTVHLLVDVLSVGRVINSYETQHGGVVRDAHAIRIQCLRVQTALIELNTARERLPCLRADFDKGDASDEADEQVSLVEQCFSGLVLTLADEDAFSRFQTSIERLLPPIHDPTEGLALVLQGPMIWLCDLLSEWTTVKRDTIKNGLPPIEESLSATSGLESPSEKDRSDFSVSPKKELPVAKRKSRSSKGTAMLEQEHTGEPGIEAKTLAQRRKWSYNVPEKFEWVQNVFVSLPSTKIPPKNNMQTPIARCYPDAREINSQLPSDHIVLFKRIFPGALRIKFLLRDVKRTVDIMCKWDNNTGSSDYAWLPISKLESRRDGEILYLCRAIEDVGKSVAWVSLPFETTELLVTFHCTFLNLRMASKNTIMAWDRALKDEAILFAAPILEQGADALRIRLDRCSGAIRLEASVQNGSRDDLLVWIAWITEEIIVRDWLQRHMKKPSVRLTQLRRHFFCYRDHAGPPDAHSYEARFSNSRDADGFYKTLQILGEQCRVAVLKRSR